MERKSVAPHVLFLNGSILSVSGEKSYGVHLSMPYWPSHVANPLLESITVYQTPYSQAG